MDLDEIIETRPKVTKREVIRELRKHDAMLSEFLLCKGDHEEYDAWDVLQWLGY